MPGLVRYAQTFFNDPVTVAWELVAGTRSVKGDDVDELDRELQGIEAEVTGFHVRVLRKRPDDRWEPDPPTVSIRLSEWSTFVEISGTDRDWVQKSARELQG